MRFLTKTLLMWLILLAAMAANGYVRVLVLQPQLGEELARQVASVIGGCIVFALAGVFVSTLGLVASRQLLAIGLLWLLLTLAFEFLVGHYVSGIGWSELLDDYDVLRGRLWPLVLLVTLCAPWWWGLVRQWTHRPNAGRRSP